MAGLGLVKRKRETITKERLQTLFPEKRNTITDEMVEIFNEAAEDPEFDGSDLLTAMKDYTPAMLKHGASMVEYLNAIRFAAHLEATGDNFTEAYIKTFSDKELVLKALESGSKESPEWHTLRNSANRFRKTNLVKEILTLANVPLYLMFNAARYQAVGVLIDEMQNANYSKDRITAADKVLTHVKEPEGLKMEMEISTGGGIQDQLSEQIARSVSMQMELLKAGKGVKEVQQLHIDTEVVSSE